MNVLVSDRAAGSLRRVSTENEKATFAALKTLEGVANENALRSRLRKVRADPYTGEEYGLWQMRVGNYLRLLLRFTEDENQKRTAIVVDVVDRRQL